MGRNSNQDSILFTKKNNNSAMSQTSYTKMQGVVVTAKMRHNTAIKTSDLPYVGNVQGSARGDPTQDGTTGYVRINNIGVKASPNRRHIMMAVGRKSGSGSVILEPSTSERLQDILKVDNVKFQAAGSHQPNTSNSTAMGFKKHNVHGSNRSSVVIEKAIPTLTELKIPSTVGVQTRVSWQPQSTKFDRLSSTRKDLKRQSKIIVAKPST